MVRIWQKLCLTVADVRGTTRVERVFPGSARLTSQLPKPTLHPTPTSQRREMMASRKPVVLASPQQILSDAQSVLASELTRCRLIDEDSSLDPETKAAILKQAALKADT